MERYTKKKRVLDIACIAFLCFCEFYFFRNMFSTGALFGDRGDGRLTMLISEHWYKVLLGKAPIIEMGFFYPAPRTLAYSDMLFGIGILHSVFRMMGFDTYIAYRTTIILIHFIGTFAIWHLLRRQFCVDSGWALFGTTAASFSCSYASMLNHTQLVALSMVPILLVLLAGFVRNIRLRRRRIYAVGAILQLVLLLYTAWYIFFFLVLFAFVFCITCIVVLLLKNREWLLLKIKELLSIKAEFVVYAVFTVILMLPFVYLELPLLRNSGGRDYSEVCLYMPEVIDLINVSERNWLLGRIIRLMNLCNRTTVQGEVATGFSLVVFLLFSGLIIWTMRNGYSHGRVRFQLLSIMLLSVLINCLLPLKISSSGTSLWQAVFHFFPGGSSIRAVGRYLLFVNMFMSVFSATTAAYIFQEQAARSRYYPILMSLLVAAVFLTNIRIGGVTSDWDHESALDFIDSVAVPPDDCEVFFIKNSDKNEYNSDFCQIDAYEIADHYNIRTINGYSGLSPNGWNGLNDISSDTYEKNVAAWAKMNGITNMYYYDMFLNEWGETDIAGSTVSEETIDSDIAA